MFLSYIETFEHLTDGEGQKLEDFTLAHSKFCVFNGRADPRAYQSMFDYRPIHSKRRYFTVKT